MPGGYKKYCISCGKKTVQWPRGRPSACSMRCLAMRVIGEYSAGGDGFRCTDWGEWADSGEHVSCQSLAINKRSYGNWIRRT